MGSLRSIGFGLGIAAALAIGAGSGLVLGGVGIRGHLTPRPAASESVGSAAFPVNARGLTYGSAAEADRTHVEPDLILVQDDAGREGYVYRSALSPEFDTPQAAAEWQRGEGSRARSLPVYLSDGLTRTGSFTVLPAEPGTAPLHP